jgi:hypothetical protein
MRTRAKAKGPNLGSWYTYSPALHDQKEQNASQQKELRCPRQPHENLYVIVRKVYKARRATTATATGTRACGEATEKAPLAFFASGVAVAFDDAEVMLALSVEVAFVDEEEFVGDMADAMFTVAAKSCGNLIVEFPKSILPSDLSVSGLAAKKDRVYITFSMKEDLAHSGIAFISMLLPQFRALSLPLQSCLTLDHIADISGLFETISCATMATDVEEPKVLGGLTAPNMPF